MEIDLKKPGFYCPGIPIRPQNSIVDNNNKHHPFGLQRLAADKVKETLCYVLYQSESMNMSLGKYCKLSERKRVLHSKQYYAKIQAIYNLSVEEILTKT
jgi:hypothetical protein